MQKILDNLQSFNIRKQENKIVLVFTLALFVYIVFILFGDFHKIEKAGLEFNWALVPFLLVLTFINYVIRAIRFNYYLRVIDVHIPFQEAFSIFIAGLSMTVTPGKTGEVVKAYFLKRTKAATVTHVIPALVIERMTDGVAMIILGAMGLFLLKQSVLFFLFAICFVAAFIFTIIFQRQVLRLIEFIEKKMPKIKLLKFFEIFFLNSQKLMSVKNFTIGVALATVAWSFEAFSLYLIVTEFAHASAAYTMLGAFFIFSFSSIAGFFVLIPAGIGVAEGSITYLLNLFFSIPISTAIFISLVFRFITLWFGVGLGVIFLLLKLRDTNGVTK